jgi:hypothetical protein
VRYDDKTEFKSDDGSPASSKDLRVGLTIRVAGDLTESGEIVAQRIELQKAPPKKGAFSPALLKEDYGHHLQKETVPWVSPLGEGES